MRLAFKAMAVLMAVPLSGCAPLLLGAGAVGGYAVSRDSVVDHFEVSQGVVYQASLAVAKKMGEITLEAPKQGIVQVRIGEVNVKIAIRQITQRTVELKVKARNKYLMPQVSVAQEVYAKIKERLST